MMQHTIDKISKLVSFDTVSTKSNLALLDYIQSDLNRWQIECHRIYNYEKTKANLYATIGPKVSGGVVLSGHTDVVPVDNQVWSTPPFKLVEDSGRLYGRGAVDMKSFVAIALSLVPEMISANLKRPIHLALSYDEEPGCLGAPDMIDEMVRTLPQIDAVVVGEPTEMKVAGSHKGVHSAYTHFSGLEAHSSQTHLGVSAVHYAARLMAEMDHISRGLEFEAVKGLHMDPPHSTLNMGVVNGGIASNIVAGDCTFSWDFRYLPNQDPDGILQKIQMKADQLEAEMRSKHPQASIKFERTHIPCLRAKTDSKAVELCLQLTGENSICAVPYGTEAGQFQERGYSTVVCGPGSIRQAHKPNEYIEIEQVEAGIAFVRNLIRRQSL